LPEKVLFTIVIVPPLYTAPPFADAPCATVRFFSVRLPPLPTESTPTLLLPLIVTLWLDPSIVKVMVTAGSVLPSVIVPLTLNVIVEGEAAEASIIACRSVPAPASFVVGYYEDGGVGCATRRQQAYDQRARYAELGQEIRGQ
jgi:hypothetical protein